MVQLDYGLGLVHSSKLNKYNVALYDNRCESNVFPDCENDVIKHNPPMPDKQNRLVKF